MLARRGEASGLELTLDPGGAAFYAPKISVQARDAIGRSWQLSTIQVDLMLPDRFDLEITAADGSRQRPVMIHRALFGSVERFLGGTGRALCGRVPTVAGAGQGRRHSRRRRVRRLPPQGSPINYEPPACESRSTPPTTGCRKKIRNAEKDKVPFLLIAGGEDEAAGAVSFRYRDRSQKNGVPVQAAVDEITERSPPAPGLASGTKTHVGCVPV